LETLFGSVANAVGLETFVKCMTLNPTRRFGLPTAVIEENACADLTLFDPDIEYVFDEDMIMSKSSNSAFLGKNLKGKALGIVARDQLVI
jgi:dihydroorotase